MTLSGDSSSQIADGVRKTLINGSGAKKPHLILSSAPIVGHTSPMLKVAGELIKRGYEITFIGGADFESMVTETGAKHVPIPMSMTPEVIAERELVPPGVPRLIFDMNVIFVGATATRWEVLKTTLEKQREADPEGKIVIVSEPLFMGANPLLLDAPLPKGFTTRPKVISFSQVPYFASSVITGPFGPGLPPDGSESGRMRNGMLDAMMEGGPFAGPLALQSKILKELGCDEKLIPTGLLSGWYKIYDMTLQMCPPSLEYDRPDVVPNVKFAGFIPPNNVRADFVYPSWWDEVTRGDRRVVTVTQGTVATQLTDLLVPAVMSLAKRDDLLVVAILGEKGATLPADVEVPANTRVIDYLPYDAVLPHTAVFVMNAGYGGVLHGVSHAVPMVLAGSTEDKPEVAMRGEWSGIAVNLRTGTPTEEAVADGVDRVLKDPSFKKKIAAIKAENESLGALDVVESQILEFAA